MVIWLTPSPSTFHVVYEWPLALTGITVSWLLHNIILWFTRNILVQWEVFLLKTWCTVEGVCNKYFVIEELLQIGLALWEGYVTSNHHNQSMFTKAWAQWKVYVVAHKMNGLRGSNLVFYKILFLPNQTIYGTIFYSYTNNKLNEFYS